MSATWQAESFDRSPHIPHSVQCTAEGALFHLLNGGVVCHVDAGVLNRWLEANKDGLPAKLKRYTDWRQMTAWDCVVIPEPFDPLEDPSPWAMIVEHYDQLNESARREYRENNRDLNAATLAELDRIDRCEESRT